MDALDTLFPDHSVELSTGEVIKLKPFTFGQLPKALKLSKSLFGLISHLFTDEAQDANVRSAIIGEVFATGGEEFIQLIALGINKPRAWFDDLAAHDGIRLAGSFLEVNVGFFAQNVIPEIKKGMAKLSKVKVNGPVGEVVDPQAIEAEMTGKTSSSS